MRSCRNISFRGALLAAAFALVAFAAAPSAQSYDLRVVHGFSGPPDDGETPSAGVRFDSAGNLYGTTEYGGAFDGGTIYKIAKDGTESILHSFEVSGTYPELAIDPVTGDLYGTIVLGHQGHNCDQECDQLYKLAPDGTFTVLHTFGSGSDGYTPSAVIRDTQGNLYGTTTNGGSYGEGTVFEYTADGTYKILHAFEKSSGYYPGYYPGGSVIRDEAGNLYGVTIIGAGLTDCGTIYRLAPDGNFTILHKFGRDPAVDDGCHPASLSAGQAGTLYGTTNYAPSGYFTVFKFTSDGTLTTLHRFTYNPVYSIWGVNPVLAVNGTLYGSVSAAVEAPKGLLFKIAPDGTYTELYQLGNGSGVGTVGRLTLKSGRLYGTTVYSDKGTGIPTAVFSLGVANP
jgi:uncharacterized repeat protein (TIGR03803 family)